MEPGTAGWEARSLPLCYVVPLWRLNIWKHPENQRNLDAPQIKQRNSEFFVSPIIVRKKNLQLGKSLSRNVSNGISRWQESRCLIPAEAAAAAGEIGLKQNRMYDHFGEVCLQSKLPTLAPWLSLEKSIFLLTFQLVWWLYSCYNNCSSLLLFT